MGKKSRLKRLRRENAAKNPSSLELREFRHPLADIPSDMLRKGFVEIGRSQAHKFLESMARAQELVRSGDPLTVLASMAYYGLMVGIREDGEIVRIGSREILPAHVEFLQALCLQIPLNQLPYAPPTGTTMQGAFDTLSELSGQFHAKRYVQIDSAKDDEDRARLLVQESIRVATQAVRNWGYYDRVKKIATELMAPLEPRFERVHGFRSCDLVLIFDHLFNEWQKRMNAHRDRLGSVFGAETIPALVDAYHAAFPDLNDDKDALVREFRDRRANLKSAKAILLSHSDLRLSELSTFVCEQVADAIGRPLDIVTKAMNRLSHRFGDLAGSNSEHFFMNNPIWIRPLIGVAEGKYFCVLPQAFFAFWFESILSLVREDDSLRDAYDTRRSSYLERRVTDLFTAAFPGAKLKENFKWHSPDRSQQFESDLVVSIDSFLFLVESKSGRVAPESRRGAADNLGQDIDALLVEPSRQSQRLESAILSAQRGEAGTEVFLREFPVDLAKIHRIIRLSVTLEDIGFLQTNVNGLKAAGYVPADLQIAPAVSVADLEIVFEILRGPPERIHYWVRRGEWEGRADYVADEIDLLGTYLKSGLNLGDLEFSAFHVVLTGESTPIDEYYEKNRVGVRADQPKVLMTDWWSAILGRIEQRKSHRWTEVAVVLLSASYDQQMEIERRVKSIVADVKKRREKAASRNALIFVPSRGRSESIGIVVMTGAQMAERHEKMENVASQAFAEYGNADQCAVIVLDVDGELYPYSTLGWFWRPTASKSKLDESLRA